MQRCCVNTFKGRDIFVAIGGHLQQWTAALDCWSRATAERRSLSVSYGQLWARSRDRNHRTFANGVPILHTIVTTSPVCWSVCHVCDKVSPYLTVSCEQDHVKKMKERFPLSCRYLVRLLLLSLACLFLILFIIFFIIIILLFIYLFIFLRRMGKSKALAPTLPRIRYQGTCVSIEPTLPLQQQLALLLPGSWACRSGLIPKDQARWR